MSGLKWGGGAVIWLPSYLNLHHRRNVEKLEKGGGYRVTQKKGLSVSIISFLNDGRNVGDIIQLLNKNMEYNLILNIWKKI